MSENTSPIPEWFCPRCGTRNSGDAKYCRTCTQPWQDAQIQCPGCGTWLSAQENFCTQCGAPLRELKLREYLMEADQELSALNEKYADKGMKRFFSGAAMGLSVFLVFMWLENNLGDWACDIGFLTFPVALVCFVVFSIQRKGLHKKIVRLLEEKTAQHLDSGLFL